MCVCVCVCVCVCILYYACVHKCVTSVNFSASDTVRSDMKICESSDFTAEKQMFGSRIKLVFHLEKEAIRPLTRSTVANSQKQILVFIFLS